MYSMTGFGCGKAAFAEGHIVLEIKSVNHRFLDIRSKAPRELLAGEAIAERLLRARISRGYCLVNLWYEGNLGGSTAIDKGALKNHLDSLIEVGKDRDLCLTDLIPTLAGAPDIFTTPRVEDEEALKSSIEEAFNQAIDELIEMRRTEGLAMTEKIVAQSERLGEQVAKLLDLSRTWPKQAKARLKERLAVLMEDPEITIDPGRLASEAALLAERADIAEETTRLESHLKQLAEVIDSMSPVGRKIEFLVQEMGREANTIASKTSLDAVAAIVIDMKADLEKMRELAQNIE
jgi:uncharacterized protein (TIGR00255 family)